MKKIKQILKAHILLKFGLEHEGASTAKMVQALSKCRCVKNSVFLVAVKYVTGSGKTGLIAQVSRFDFSPRTQSYMNKLSNFTIKIS